MGMAAFSVVVLVKSFDLFLLMAALVIL